VFQRATATIDARHRDFFAAGDARQVWARRPHLQEPVRQSTPSMATMGETTSHVGTLLLVATTTPAPRNVTSPSSAKMSAAAAASGHQRRRSRASGALTMATASLTRWVAGAGPAPKGWHAVRACGRRREPAPHPSGPDTQEADQWPRARTCG
jgi:hypothetical protein